MAVIKETIDVEEKPAERKFIVKRYVEDELTATQLIENLKNVREEIKRLEQMLVEAPLQYEQAKNSLEKNIAELKNRDVGLAVGLAKAEVWAKELDRQKKENKDTKEVPKPKGPIHEAA